MGKMDFSMTSMLIAGARVYGDACVVSAMFGGG